jgi:hypothetical protein
MSPQLELLFHAMVNADRRLVKEAGLTLRPDAMAPRR